MPSVSFAGAPMTAERKQVVIGRARSTNPFEKEPCGNEGERQTVSTVTKREEVTRISRVRPDVRQAVRREREEPFPAVFDANVRERRPQRDEVIAERVDFVPQRRTASARHARTIAATRNQPVVTRPARSDTAAGYPTP